MELIKAGSQPVVVIDTDEEKGIDSFVLGVSEGKGANEKYVEKVRKAFQTHHSLHRNFNRRGKNHNHEGYSSEQGVWQNGDDNVRFVGHIVGTLD